jgi:nucleotide-binding universal stress UspA family protein
MGYKTILAFLPNVDQASAALNAARLVARRDGDHVIGLYVFPAMRVYGAMPVDAPNVTAQLIEQNRAFHEAESGKVKALFEAAFADEDVHAEWRFSETMRVSPLPEIIDQGRAAELIVTPHIGETDDTFEDGRIADRLMMESGRPVLIAPAGDIASIGSDITVGWNASREAARAVFDALPLLQQADNVHVVWVDPRLPSGQSVSRAADDIAASLARAGVHCEAVEATAGGGSIGAELLNRARDYGSDLIVMGGYGRTRFREMIFGGATRHMLDHMNVPILMSH